MADLVALAQQHLDVARRSEHGRSAELVVHDGPLRQTVIALRAGSELPEHNAPPAASLQVLVGSVRVVASAEDLLTAGDLALLTHHRHAVAAVEDAVFLLTAVTGVATTETPERAR